MGLLIFFAFISVFFSFLCSILEAVLLSTTRMFINLHKKAGHGYAYVLEELKKDVDKPLIAILTLNTVAHTVGAILVGVQAKVVYMESYGSKPTEILGVNFTEEAMVGVVSAIMTLLVLVASEIIPKTIGATYWRKLAGFTATSLKIMVWIMKWTGMMWVLQLFTRMIGDKGHQGSILSREDFTAMADIAKEEGVFEETESLVIKNMLKFDEILAKDIMTPRAVMTLAPQDQSVQEFFDENPSLRFSRIPVFGENMDIITGFVLKDEILVELVREKGHVKLEEIRRELLVTTRNTPIPQLFDTFITKREHIALVVDEYGSVSGIVTMEDILETLLGLEIMDESDKVEDLQQLARKKWEERAKRTGIIE